MVCSRVKFTIVYDLFDVPFLKVVNLGLSPGLANIKYTHGVHKTLKETNRNAEPTSKTSVKNRNDKANEPSKDRIEYKIVDAEQRTVIRQYKIPHTSYQSVNCSTENQYASRNETYCS